MSDLWRLLRLFAPQTLPLLLGVLAALMSLLFGLSVFATTAIVTVTGAGALLLRSAAGLRLVARYAERLLTHQATFKVLARLRLWLFARLVPLAPGALGLMRSGDLLSRLTADIDALDGFYLRFLLPLALGTLALAGVVSVWVLLGGAPLLLVQVLSLCGLSLFVIYRAVRESLRQLNPQAAQLRVHIADGLVGLAELQASGAAPQQAQILARATATLNRAQLAASRAEALARLLAQGLHLFFLVALFKLAFGTLPPTYALAVVLGYLALSEVLLPLPLSLLNWARLHPSAARLFALADLPSPLTEPTATHALPPSRTLVFNDVGLTYPGRPPVLRNISFTLPEGEQLGLRGASGAGKSSVAMMLLKFTAPTSGMISIGGENLAKLSGPAWRAQVAYLSQRTALIAGTVRDNLTLAAPHAHEPALWQALQDVGLKDVVEALPDGLDTWIGEDGLKLSGGQARRLALAMVLLKGAPVWILDEPTEGLDDETAQALLATLRRLAAGKTLLYITHNDDELAALGLTAQVTLPSL